MSDEDCPAKKQKVLTDAELEKIEKNRQKALKIRQAKLLSNPITEISTTSDKNVIKVEGVRFVDSGGGFLVEESTMKKKTQCEELPNTKHDTIELPVTYEECIECNDQFACSYLWDNFRYPACDACRDSEEKHSLITRTEAKQEYLLKDCDLDKREPILKYISRVNPHNSHWGQMKLYLHIQIEKRALEVWGSEENLLKEREEREGKREKTKVKKYNKELKALRMDVRSSLYNKTSASSHTHTYGPEVYNEEDDIYTHTCTSCNFVEEFEKM